MKQQECLAKGIIFLAHLMSLADGVRDDTEIRALTSGLTATNV